ncbi:MAG: SGNH/GDSL hydrolase family protein [Actinobacteria bacterium]|nr:SGNH/GDSL hydrolase family protein [Actinomycetota bacterium]
MSDQPQTMAAALVRSVHPEKVFDYLPGMTPANLAALYGLDEPGYRALRDRYAAQARQAAQALLAGQPLSAAAARLPFAAAETVAVVGESTTDAADSWLEILGHVLQQRPGGQVRLVNAAVSGYPTTMLQRVLAAVLIRHHPDWVIIFAGANDILRYGADATKPLVHAAETGRNLAEMHRAARAAGARMIWMTPTGIDIGKARNYPPFQHQQIWLDPADAAAVDQAVRAQATKEDLLVDLGDVLGQPPSPELLDPDGVHPSPAGHAAIARACIDQLAGQPRRR